MSAVKLATLQQIVQSERPGSLKKAKISTARALEARGIRVRLVAKVLEEAKVREAREDGPHCRSGSRCTPAPHKHSGGTGIRSLRLTSSNNHSSRPNS